MAASYWQPVTPKEGDLEYRGLKLHNGMTVLLVHVPAKEGEEKAHSAAALSLARGNLSDPNEFPGMAHFCEHMLFLGNEKYPVEGEYRKYLQEHGGRCNASTGPEMTLYKFQITDEYFEGGLDRFLNFFKTPLFTESATHREVQAVDSEYKRNTLSDRIRCFNLVKHLSNPDHVFGRFGSGNHKSLSEIPESNGLDLRSNLLSFYNKNYSADIMNLVIVSTRSLDKLEEMVTKEDSFPAVPAKGLQKRLSFPGIPFEEHHVGRIIEYLPLQDKLLLDAYIPMPQSTVSKDPTLRCSRLIAHIIGHEGTGTLSHSLLEKGLITSLSASDNLKESFGHIKVAFVLSDEGYKNISLVVSSLCHYASLICSELDTTCKRIHAERKQAKELLFDFQQQKASLPLATSLASSLRSSEVPEECIRHPYLLPPVFDDYQKDSMRECLGFFKPQSMLLALTNADIKTSNRPLLTEPWWGVTYAVRSLTDSEMTEMSLNQSAMNMVLPEENEWLPKSTETLPLDTTGSSIPVKVDISPRTVVWWKSNKKYVTPKCKIMTSIQNNMLSSTAVGVVVGELLAELLDYGLSSKYYYAQVATAYSITFSKTQSSITLATTGFTDCAIRLCEHLVRDVFNFNFSEDHFNVLRKNCVRNNKNSKLRNTTIQASRTMSELFKVLPVHSDIDREMETISFTDFKEYVSKFRNSSIAEVITFGNISQDLASQLGKTISSILDDVKIDVETPSRPLPKSILLPESTLKESLCLQHEPNPANKESAVAVRYQFGVFSYELAAKMIVLKSIVSPRFFTTLRTREQLGYGVSTAYHCVNDVLCLQFGVRSSTEPDVVHKRIDVFFKTFHEELLAMSEKDINDCVASSKSGYAAPCPNMIAEFNEFSYEITHQVYRWDRDQNMMNEFNKITRSDIISLFENFIRPVSWSTPSRRSVMSVYSLTDSHYNRLKQCSSNNRIIDDDVEVFVNKINEDDIQQWREGMEQFEVTNTHLF